MRLKIVGALLMVLFSFNRAMCQEKEPVLKDNIFVMAFIRPENDYLGKLWRLTYTEVFKRLSIKVEFRDYPPKRASIEADAGNVDGEPGRPYQYSAEYPNLIRVEEILFFLNFSAFTAKDSIPPLKGWDSLKGTNYKVEYRRGVMICEVNLSKIMGKENLSDVTEPIQGLKKIVSGRTDLFVYDEAWILPLLQTPEFKDSKIRSVGLMESVHLYPYLHKMLL